MSNTYDAGDLCVYCGKDTSWGSGRFVNRLAAGADIESAVWLEPTEREGFDFIDGFACAECMEQECARCGKGIALDEDYDVWEENWLERVHYECLTVSEIEYSLANDTMEIPKGV